MRLVVDMDQLVISFVNTLNSLVMFWPKLDLGVSKSCEFVSFLVHLDHFGAVLLARCS